MSLLFLPGHYQIQAPLRILSPASYGYGQTGLMTSSCQADSYEHEIYDNMLRIILAVKEYGPSVTSCKEAVLIP